MNAMLTMMRLSIVLQALLLALSNTVSAENIETYSLSVNDRKNTGYDSVEIFRRQVKGRDSALLYNSKGVYNLSLLDEEIFNIKSMKGYLKIESLTGHFIHQIHNNDLYRLHGKCCYYNQLSNKLHIYSITLEYEILDEKAGNSRYQKRENIIDVSTVLKKRNINEEIVNINIVKNKR